MAHLPGQTRHDREQTLKQFAYAEEFARRQKHRKVWVKVAALALFALSVLPAIWAVLTKDWKVRLFWFIPAALGLLALKRLLRYSKGSPHCPHCQQDITNCCAGFCHACGLALHTIPCERCGRDPNWTAGLQDMGLRYPIIHCPGCGVRLNTNFYRYERDTD
jgi:hypothetical protein